MQHADGVAAVARSLVLSGMQDMSEAEAKTKCCPLLALVSGRGDASCIASGCMMWRGHQERLIKGGPEEHGFCGLAGIAPRSF